MAALVFLSIWCAATVFLVVAFGRPPWRGLSAALRTYSVTSWALVAIGAIQAVVTPMRYEGLSEAALWFSAAGFAVALTGAVNLLSLGKKLGESSLRRVSTMASLVVTLIFVAVATHRGSELPHDPVSGAMILVGAAATALSTGGRFMRLERTAS